MTDDRRDTTTRSSRWKRWLWPLAGTAAAVALLLIAWSVEFERIVPAAKLPTEAQSFLRQAYPDADVALVRWDLDELRVTYTAFFADGTRVAFRRNGEWKSIEGKFRPVPEGTVPPPIADFVARNFAGAQVYEIARGRRAWKVELTNSVELTFDRKHLSLVDYDD